MLPSYPPEMEASPHKVQPWLTLVASVHLRLRAVLPLTGGKVLGTRLATAPSSPAYTPTPLLFH